METYIISLEKFIDMHGDPIAMKIDGLTGEACAVHSPCAGQYREVWIDTPLCGSCDRPVKAGRCHECEED